MRESQENPSPRESVQPPGRWLPTRAAADFLGFSPRTLESWHWGRVMASADNLVMAALAPTEAKSCRPSLVRRNSRREAFRPVPPDEFW